MIDRDQIIQALRAIAAVNDDGVQYVRMAPAAKAIGCCPSVIQRWERQGRLRVLRFRVPRVATAPTGLVSAIRLDDLVRCVRRYRPMREVAWTRDQQEQLLDLIGTMSVRRIAAQLGRSVRGVRHQLRALGVSALDHGLWSVRDVARLTGRCPAAVLQWVYLRGLPAKRLPRPAIDPRELCRWLIGRRRLWARLDADARRRVLELRSAVTQRRAA